MYSLVHDYGIANYLKSLFLESRRSITNEKEMPNPLLTRNVYIVFLTEKIQTINLHQTKNTRIEYNRTKIKQDKPKQGVTLGKQKKRITFSKKNCTFRPKTIENFLKCRFFFVRVTLWR